MSMLSRSLGLLLHRRSISKREVSISSFGGRRKWINLDISEVLQVSRILRLPASAEFTVASLHTCTRSLQHFTGNSGVHLDRLDKVLSRIDFAELFEHTMLDADSPSRSILLSSSEDIGAKLRLALEAAVDAKDTALILELSETILELNRRLRIVDDTAFSIFWSDMKQLSIYSVDQVVSALKVLKAFRSPNPILVEYLFGELLRWLDYGLEEYVDLTAFAGALNLLGQINVIAPFWSSQHEEVLWPYLNQAVYRLTSLVHSTDAGSHRAVFLDFFSGISLLNISIDIPTWFMVKLPRQIRLDAKRVTEPENFRTLSYLCNHAATRFDSFNCMTAVRFLQRLVDANFTPNVNFLNLAMRHVTSLLPLEGRSELHVALTVVARLSYLKRRDVVRFVDCWQNCAISFRQILTFRDMCTSLGCFRRLDVLPSAAFIGAIRDRSDQMIDSCSFDDINSLLFSFARLNVMPSQQSLSRWIQRSLELAKSAPEMSQWKWGTLWRCYYAMSAFGEWQALRQLFDMTDMSMFVSKLDSAVMLATMLYGHMMCKLLTGSNMMNETCLAATLVRLNSLEPSLQRKCDRTHLRCIEVVLGPGFVPTKVMAGSDARRFGGEYVSGQTVTSGTIFGALRRRFPNEVVIDKFVHELGVTVSFAAESDDGKRYAFVYRGPRKFFKDENGQVSSTPTTFSSAKVALLKKVGYHVVTLPFFDVDMNSTVDDVVAYIEPLLDN